MQKDQQDPLAKFKEQFFVEPGTIYMDGNSLGLMSKRAETKLIALMDSWKRFGIEGWTEGEHPWFTLAERLSEKAAPLFGAEAHEVMVTGSITSNRSTSWRWLRKRERATRSRYPARRP